MKSSSDFLILKFPPLLTLKRVSEEEEIFEEAFEEIEEIEEVFEEKSEEIMNKCNDCKFFLSDDIKLGYCLALPPILSETLLKQSLKSAPKKTDIKDIVRAAQVFPVVTTNSWCGKWEVK